MRTHGRSYVLLALLLALTMALLVPQISQAAGTTAGTAVDNQATINYKVGGIDQTAIKSAPTGSTNSTGAVTTFSVDTKVNFSITWDDTPNVYVTPGVVNSVLTFTVTNQSNATLDFLVSQITNGTDDFNPSTVGVYVDSNANGTYQFATDTATFINNLAADGSIKVFIVGNIPSTPTNGQLSSHQLVVNGADSGTSALLVNDTSPSLTTGSEIVFADTGYDNVEKKYGVFEVRTASLKVTKTVSVISDPVNGTSSPFAIPGATIEYTVRIDNNSTASSATSVSISDTLPGVLTNATASYASSNAIMAIFTNGATETYTAAADADKGSMIADVINVNSISVGPSNSVSVYFRATID